ncbi:MAG TPA: hypothetical protein EYP08_06215, partial [Pyrodictiaceae archaeon]|nr:hypothetical protein [Pyrodictiaceae archaeon]
MPICCIFLAVDQLCNSVNVCDDPTLKEFGFFPFDDEGVKAERKTIIENGILNRLDICLIASIVVISFFLKRKNANSPLSFRFRS